MRFRPLLGVFALAAATAYVGRALGRTGGALSPPLDDTYIYLQYARRLAEGHGLSYSGTAAPSTGATSWLHLLLLVPGRLLGLKDAAFVVFPLLLGVVYLALTLHGAARAAAGMAPGGGPGGPAGSGGGPGGGPGGASGASGAPGRHRAPISAAAAAWAVLAVIGLSGHYLWGAFSGMDTALFGAGLALTLAAVAQPGAARRPAAWLFCGLLPWLRPEGAPAGLVGAGVLAVSAWRDARRGGARRPVDSAARDPAVADDRAGGATPDTAQTRVDAAARQGVAAPSPAPSPRAFNFFWPLAALLLGAGPFLLNRLITGHFTSDGFALKSIWGEERPDLRELLWRGRPAVMLDILRLFVSDFRVRAFGAGPLGGTLAALNMALTGAGLAAGFVVGLSGRRGAGGALAALWFALLVASGSLSAGWDQHHFRYHIPTLVPAALLMVMGWSALAARAGGATPRVFASLVVLAVALQLPGAIKMSDVYAWNCSNIHDQQEKVGRWLRAQTPAGARVALNDAGAIAYYSDRPTLDLLGLTSHGWAATFRAGNGALWERLERLPAAERPDYFAIYPRWFPRLTHTDFLAEEILKVDLPYNTICGDRLKVVYRPDWTWADRGRGPVARRELVDAFGMQVLDEIDVADATSEAAHGYRWRDTYEDFLRELPCGTEEGAVIIDGGRRVSVGETFRVKTRPHEPVALLLRTQSEADLTLSVRVNGRPAGNLVIARRPGVFTEPFLQIADSLATDSTLTIDVQREPDAAGTGYQSYHYWVLR